ncbi:hypothetical protein D9758_014952 [Tetrapyrgos nigripes]|uniref:Pheromone receptor n=1 Tax=Tetrapyrgos nigripes TaxID=182062 RepID=A0A8H5CLD3_9AGAR|nr:hypothetical protein D9758_014952 [Tetrapyrgos nigripes]
MYDPTYPAFPILAFIGFILVLIPLPWHIQAWNSGTSLFMIWTALGCLNFFINAIVWRNDAIDRAPVWCDISVALNTALNVAIPCASLCINRRLYNIATCKTASVTRADKRRQVIIDLAIGVGLPVLQVPLHYIVQGHRYDLIEQIGCWPTTFNTPPAYPLSFLWVPVISLISMTYGVLTLRAFMKRRQQFSQFLSRNGGMNVSRYFRLMCLAMVEIFITAPITAYGLSLNIRKTQIQPWISWENTHFDFNVIDTLPAILWRYNRQAVITMELARWPLIVGPFIFFAFFGFAEEARKHYKLAFNYIRKRLGFALPPKVSAFTSSFKKKDEFVPLPMAHTPNLPRSLILPHITVSTSGSRDSITSVAATSLHKSDLKFDDSPSPAMPSPPPLYKPRESFPSSPTSSSSCSATYIADDEPRPHSGQVFHDNVSLSESKLGVAL